MTHELPNSSNDTLRYNRYELIGKKEWEHNTVTFFYNPDYSPFSLADAELVINDAVALLNYFTNLTYVYGGTTDKLPNVRLGEQDDQVTIGWADISNAMPGGETLAVTRNIVGFDWITDSGIAFNTEYDAWNPINNPNYLTCFESTLLHELVHLAGIGHTNITDTLMKGAGAVLNTPGSMALRYTDLLVFEYKYPTENNNWIITDPVCKNYPAGDPRKDMLGARDVYIPVIAIEGNPEYATAKLSYLEPTQEIPAHMPNLVPGWRNKFDLSYFMLLSGLLYDGLTQNDFLYTNIATANNETLWLNNVYIRGQMLPEARFDRLAPNSSQWILTYYTGM